jgi:hypothetical protein
LRNASATTMTESHVQGTQVGIAVLQHTADPGPAAMSGVVRVFNAPKLGESAETCYFTSPPRPYSLDQRRFSDAVQLAPQRPQRRSYSQLKSICRCSELRVDPSIHQRSPDPGSSPSDGCTVPVSWPPCISRPNNTQASFPGRISNSKPRTVFKRTRPESTEKPPQHFALATGLRPVVLVGNV